MAHAIAIHQRIARDMPIAHGTTAINERNVRIPRPGPRAASRAPKTHAGIIDIDRVHHHHEAAAHRVSSGQTAQGRRPAGRPATYSGRLHTPTAQPEPGCAAGSSVMPRTRWCTRGLPSPKRLRRRAASSVGDSQTEALPRQHAAAGKI